jgi:glycosyltransferase involved in cell wall biosynthesis
MRFCIVTHVVHKYSNGKYWAYGPYVKEMNIWEKSVSHMIIVAPLSKTDVVDPIDLPYTSEKITFIAVPEFNLTSKIDCITTIWKLPLVIYSIFRGMFISNHVHLRCPGNMGLLGALIQVFFPYKRKTAKYAGNWDWKSKQPWSFRLQQRILRSTFFSRNIQVLVYGDWQESKNIKPFFTASYFENEKFYVPIRNLELNEAVRLIFVGTLNDNKRPLLSLEVAKELNDFGVKSEIHFYGEGDQKNIIEESIIENELGTIAFVHGNVNSKELIKAYSESHFLIFISKSEGWPKALAEAMFWGCFPLTSNVSCVPEMIGYGERGDLVEPDSTMICNKIINYLNASNNYKLKCKRAMEWSRRYTLDRFQLEIKNLVE